VVAGPRESGTMMQGEDEDMPTHGDGKCISPPEMGPSSAQGRRSMSLVSEESAQPETPPSENLDADHDDAPFRYSKMLEIIGPSSPPGQATRGFQG
jgi:hypothetical protein